MKNRLLSALTAGCVIFSAGAKELLRYPAAELRELDGVRSWRIGETLQEEPCWITLSYDTGKNGSDRLARSLYLNGRLIPCSRASAYQYRGGRYFVTMQSDQPHRVRKDDVISLAEHQRGTVEALEIRKTPRKDLPLRLPSPKKNQLLQMESDRGSGLDAHRLCFRLRNLSGKARGLSVRMRIMDYYGTPVAERTLSFRLEKEREIFLPYRSGSSVQYRASVEVTEADGTSRSFGYSFLADGPEAPGGRHFRQHLNTGWEVAEIPDDGTLKTRTLQKSPPPGAVFRKTDLPCTWDTPIVFFRKQFHKEIQLFVCESWILNPDWITELPDSNLTRLMREVYLFPIQETERAGLFFVYGRDDGDLSSYPADNSLHRAFRHLIDTGHPLREGGMFFLTADLPRFGTGTYR